MAKLLWTQKQDIGPAPRVGHAMAYDAARGRVVLFGGDTLGPEPFGDTWIWDGEDWTQVEDIGPAPRAGHAMAYDRARERVVLFGGHTAAELANDTWEWDGQSWTQIQDQGPDPREGHAMAYDAARARVVLFGGALASGPTGDTWGWDGSDWVQQDDTGPSPRSGHGLTYDIPRERVVLFGGVGANNPNGLDDTWEWDGALWKQVADFGPEGCFGCALVFRSDRAALFGGLSTLADVPARKLFGLTWEWDGRHWTARQDIGVGARSGHAMAFDSARGRVVLFGGLRGFVDAPDPARLRGDTWEHIDTPAGPPPVQPGQPVPIASLVAAPDPVHPGEEFTIVAALAGPAPADGQVVTIESNLGPIGDLTVNGGEASGALSFVMPQEIAGNVALPFSLEITATSAGNVVAIVVTIEA